LPVNYQLGKTRFHEPKNIQPKTINFKTDEPLPDDVPFSVPPSVRTTSGSETNIAITNVSQDMDNRQRHDTGISDMKAALIGNVNTTVSPVNDSRYASPSAKTFHHNSPSTPLFRHKEQSSQEKEQEQEQQQEGNSPNYSDDGKEKKEKRKKEKKKT